MLDLIEFWNYVLDLSLNCRRSKEYITALKEGEMSTA